MQVYAIATEDMDALTFATPRLIRNLCAAQAAKLPITEYEYDKVLEGLKLTADQFVDLCILCGCDYCGSIKGQPVLRNLLCYEGSSHYVSFQHHNDIVVVQRLFTLYVLLA